METKNITLSKIAQKIHSPEFAYLSVIFIFFTIVIILFLISTDFAAKNIDKIFSPIKKTADLALNMENYSLIVKRFNLPTNSPQENTAPVEMEIKTTETPPTNTPLPVLDKKSITINILNTTNKKGVAAALAKKLEAAGFSTATTGNDKKTYNLTTIIVSGSKKEYLPSLEEVIKTTYPKVVTETVADKTDFDVTIMIGKK